MLSVYVTYIYPWESNNERVAGSNDGIKDSLATKKLCRCVGGGGRRLVSIRGQIFINDYGSHDPWGEHLLQHQLFILLSSPSVSHALRFSVPFRYYYLSLSQVTHVYPTLNLKAKCRLQMPAGAPSRGWICKPYTFWQLRNWFIFIWAFWNKTPFRINVFFGKIWKVFKCLEMYWLLALNSFFFSIDLMYGIFLRVE